MPSSSMFVCFLVKQWVWWNVCTNVFIAPRCLRLKLWENIPPGGLLQGVCKRSEQRLKQGMSFLCITIVTKITYLRKKKMFLMFHEVADSPWVYYVLVIATRDTPRCVRSWKPWWWSGQRTSATIPSSASSLPWSRIYASRASPSLLLAPR